MINEGIMYHDDVEDLATEIFDSKNYSFAIELKRVRLAKQLEEQQITRTTGDVEIITRTTRDDK